jgi:hypothetical protein
MLKPRHRNAEQDNNILWKHDNVKISGKDTNKLNQWKSQEEIKFKEHFFLISSVYFLFFSAI